MMTVSHPCVVIRPNPSAFQVKISLWEKGNAQDTTDIIPVQEIYIHPKYLFTYLPIYRSIDSSSYLNHYTWRNGRLSSKKLWCRYNATSYENDIALVQMKMLPGKKECFEDNPAVRAICVPWTTQLFHANHSCSISGWGRNRGECINVPPPSPTVQKEAKISWKRCRGCDMEEESARRWLVGGVVVSRSKPHSCLTQSPAEIRCQSWHVVF